MNDDDIPALTEPTHYRMESLIPTYMRSDQAYLAALKEVIAARMTMQGYEIVSGPYIEDITYEGARIPVGMTLLMAYVSVVEFDIEVPLDPEAASLIGTQDDYFADGERKQYNG